MRRLFFALLLVLVATPAWAALAHVQTQKQANSAAGTSISITLTLTAGNAVIVNVNTYLAATTITPDGTNPDTLTAVAGGSLFNAAGGIKQFCAVNVTGGSTTYKFNFDVSTTAATVFVTEISGMAAGASCAAFDQVATNTDLSGTGTALASGTTGTTTQADEIAVAAFGFDGSGVMSSYTVDNSFTIPTNGNYVTIDPGGNGVVSGVAYRIVTATGTYTTTATHTPETTAGLAVIGTYKAAAAAGGACQRTLVGVGC